MAAKKNVRSTTRQIDMLVDYMSTHTQFANGEYRGILGREDQDEEWVRLQQILQDYGPNKTVEQWRTTWRDLKKKARADGARVNSARAETGNHTPIPSLSNTIKKILNIIAAAGRQTRRQVTGQGEILPQPPAKSPRPVKLPQPATSPSVTLFTSPPDTKPSTYTNPGPSVPKFIPPSTPSTQQAVEQALARGQRARTLKSYFLVSDAETKRVLQDIKKSQNERNKLSERKMRRSHLQRLHSSRMVKHHKMGPKN